ncbi:MAG: PQQ-binding-like beta-propeller repeat protein [Thermoplasmata archaeon]|nr:PQQ-binding-like beta-propeller repeat protein [Thermoplasmata archaeon]
MPDPRRTTDRRRHTLWAAVIAFVGLAVLVVSLFATSPPAPPAASGVRSATNPAAPTLLDWTTFHGGENRSGFVPAQGPIDQSRAFIVCLGGGGGNSTPIRVGPVVNATRVFVADVFGHLAAYNLTGALEWSTTGHVEPTTADLLPPFLVVGAGDGSVTAYDAATGAVDWSTYIGGRVVEGVVDDGVRVYVGSTIGTIAAIDLGTGSVAWKLAVGNGLAGALALEGGQLYAATANGTVLALTPGGSVLWSRNVGASLATSVAVAYGKVIVADRSANVTALNPTNGSTLWRFIGHTVRAGDVIESTPAVGDGGVFVATDLGSVLAIDVTNGSLRWARTTGYTGYPVLASPALGFNAVYLVDANEFIDAYAVGSGTLLWSSSLFSEAVYSSPALSRGAVYVGNEVGCLTAFGQAGLAGPPEPVSGTVRERNGTPVAGELLSAGVASAITAANGTYLIGLPNGTYELTASGAGFPPVTRVVAVAGPTRGVDFVLTPPTIYVLTGTVVDSRSGHPLAGLVVTVQGAYGYQQATTTTRFGAFTLAGPNGSNYVTVDPPSGYDGFATHVFVNGGPVAGIALRLDSTAPAFGDPTSAGVAIVLPLFGLALATVAYYVVDSQRRRRAEGLPPAILTPIARFVVMRGLLVPVQVVGVLVVLYIFGTYLTSEAYNFPPGSLFTSPGPARCYGPHGWSDPVCSFTAFGEGFWSFLVHLFTLQWGLASFGNLKLPALQFLVWWAPDSIELAAVALALSAGIAYVLGLAAGWRRESVFDYGVRTGSLVGLLVPTFLVLLLLDALIATPLNRALGDSPFGMLPTQFWYTSHGGVPPWLGPGSNTHPTGFPLIDGLVHGAWSFELVVLTKTMLQAILIAIVYVAIFLRYARHAVASAVREPFVVAARARGIQDPTLLWHHTARRVLPMFVLIFGITLPVYLGTQAIVEALSNDTGVGALLLSEFTKVGRTGFGISTVGTGPPVGNFYQVTIFLLVILILVGNLLADVLARMLDPRLLAPSR